MHTCSAERLVYGQVKAIMICRPYVWILVLFVEHDNVAFMLPTLVGFLALSHACFVPGEERKKTNPLQFFHGGRRRRMIGQWRQAKDTPREEARGTD